MDKHKNKKYVVILEDESGGGSYIQTCYHARNVDDLFRKLSKNGKIEKLMKYWEEC
ncbi:MAG: hypothetical protein HFE33_05380 [Clostridia bacterium]|nr:hypothetical protein [Clostridia bacterium]